MITNRFSSTMTLFKKTVITSVILFSSLHSAQFTERKLSNEYRNKFYNILNSKIEQTISILETERKKTILEYGKDINMEFCLSEHIGIMRKINSEEKTEIGKITVKRVSQFSVSKENSATDLDLVVMEKFKKTDKDYIFMGNGNSFILFKPLYAEGKCLNCHVNITKEDKLLFIDIYGEDKEFHQYEKDDLIGLIRAFIK